MSFTKNLADDAVNLVVGNYATNTIPNNIENINDNQTHDENEKNNIQQDAKELPNIMKEIKEIQTACEHKQLTTQEINTSIPVNHEIQKSNHQVANIQQHAEPQIVERKTQQISQPPHENKPHIRANAEHKNAEQQTQHNTEQTNTVEHPHHEQNNQTQNITPVKTAIAGISLFKKIGFNMTTGIFILILILIGIIGILYTKYM